MKKKKMKLKKERCDEDEEEDEGIFGSKRNESRAGPKRKKLTAECGRARECRSEAGAKRERRTRQRKKVRVWTLKVENIQRTM